MNPFSSSDREKFTKESLFNASFYISLFSYIKKSLFQFHPTERIGRFLIEPELLLEDFKKLRMLLQELRDQNVSDDPIYLEKLSTTWHKIKTDYRPMVQSKHPTQITIEHFLDSLENFPPHTDHTLGFYLTHYQKDTWTPFPFLEQLSSLHQHFQHSPSNNPLQSWLLQVKEIIEDLEI